MEDHALRFGIRGGGCSGYSYVLEFSDGPEEGDDTIEVAGLRVFVGDFKRDFLAGTLIDYETSEWEAGFKIKNPNAKRPCGCGESFDIDEQSRLRALLATSAALGVTPRCLHPRPRVSCPGRPPRRDPGPTVAVSSRTSRAEQRVALIAPESLSS
ncbi:MAG: iron-sulfur cluster assembly accessory protein [Alphaproteobacteria bacterium]|nr:iron-sulfur cluster assembly accessory protein [Alphaproteobacteria bacterium]